MTGVETAINTFFVARGHVLADSTQRTYRTRLIHLERFAESNGLTLETFDGIQFDLFVAYVCKLEDNRTGKKDSKATIRSILHVSIIFFKWCLKYRSYKRIVPSDLKEAIDEVELPREDEHVQPLYTYDMVSALIEACHKAYRQDELAVRNEAIVCLLFDTGIRAEECLTLKKYNVHISEKDEHSYILVDGKREKERKIKLGNTTVKALKRYLSIRPQDTDIEEFFVSMRRDASGNYTPLHYPGLHQLMRRLLEEAKIDKQQVKKTLHQFRHSSSVEYYRSTGSVKGLQVRLGHTDFRSLKPYIQAFTAEDELENGVSPLDDLNDRGKRKKRKKK